MCVYIWTFCICVLNLSVTSLHCCSDSHPFCCHSLNFRITGAPSRMVLVCDTLGNSSNSRGNSSNSRGTLRNTLSTSSLLVIQLPLVQAPVKLTPSSSIPLALQGLILTRLFWNSPPPPAAVTRVGRAQV